MRTNILRWLASALLVTILADPVAAGVDRWTPIGPDGGEILSLAADADNPGTLYAGTRDGGVWKSLDSGGSWTPTAEGLGDDTVFTLAASAGRVYAGTSSSLYLLTAGAAAWRQVGPASYSAEAISVDPTSPDRIWSAGDSYGKVLVSEDGGEHWSPKLSLFDFLFAVTAAPTAPPTVYAAGNEGVFASTDAGTTWRQFQIGNGSQPSAPYAAWALAVDPGNAETLYARAPDGFWKTTDAGEHWSHAADPVFYPPIALIALPGTLLSAGLELRRSEDGGDTWDQVQGIPSFSFSCLAADPAAPAGAWAGTLDTSLWRTSDSGRTWVKSGRGLRASNIQAFAFDPFRPRTLYAVTPGARLQRSVDAGAFWGRTLSRLDIRSLAADPIHPGTLYAATPRGVSLSRDRGAHWQPILNDPFSLQVVAVDPDRPGTIWAGGSKLWRSNNAGRTWTRLPNPIDTEFSSAAKRIYFSPWHPGTLYLIDFYGTSLFVPRTLSRSTDDGLTWEDVGLGDPVALAFDPTTPDVLIEADVFGIIRKSRNGGTTWETVASDAGGGYPLTALVIDPLDPSDLFIGTTGAGVWRSRDQGATWQPYSTGMIAHTITCLEMDPRNPRRLVACTQGGGLLEIQISSGS